MKVVSWGWIKSKETKWKNKERKNKRWEEGGCGKRRSDHSFQNAPVSLSMQHSMNLINIDRVFMHSWQKRYSVIISLFHSPNGNLKHRYIMSTQNCFFVCSTFKQILYIIQFEKQILEFNNLLSFHTMHIILKSWIYIHTFKYQFTFITWSSRCRYETPMILDATISMSSFNVSIYITSLCCFHQQYMFCMYICLSIYSAAVVDVKSTKR